MNVKIWDDKYVIKSDSRQYKLVEIKEKAPTEEDSDIEMNNNGTYEVILGYFTTMESLFREVVSREGRLNKCTTLEGYIKHIEKINKKLEENLEIMAAIIGGKESLKRIMTLMPDQFPEELVEKKKKGKK